MPEEEKLSVVLVDDEPGILEGLHTTFDWDGFGFSVVGVAGSGERALELMEQYDPDVVVTDIRMRTMNGLELIETRRRTRPDQEFVVVSAYDDFDYAQQACSLGVYSYLLKPVEDEQLQKVMSDLASLIRERKRASLRLDEYRSFVDDRRHDLEEQLLKRLVSGTAGIEEIRNQLALMDSALSDDQLFCVICLDTDVQSRILADLDAHTHRYIVTQSCIGLLSGHYPLWSFEGTDGRTDVVVRAAGLADAPDTVIGEQLAKISQKIDPSASATLVAVPGPFVRGLQGIVVSAAHAYAEFEYTMGIGAPVRNEGRVRLPVPAGVLKYPVDTGLQIIRDIRTGDLGGMSNHIRDFGARAAGFDHVGRCLLYQRLCNDIGRYLFETTGFSGRECERLVRFSEHIFKLPDGEMLKVLEEILSDLIERRQELHVDLTAAVYDGRIRDAQLFIDLRLNDERLSVRDIAAHVYLNTAYLGRLFKKRVGVALSEYLARRRIERAQDLLSTTDLSVQQISEEVGIPNTSYFSTVFRKYVSMSPSEYRLRG